jgi:hypothetical protein
MVEAFKLCRWPWLPLLSVRSGLFGELQMERKELVLPFQASTLDVIDRRAVIPATSEKCERQLFVDKDRGDLHASRLSILPSFLCFPVPPVHDPLLW